MIGFIMESMMELYTKSEIWLYMILQVILYEITMHYIDDGLALKMQERNLVLFCDCY